MLPCTPSELVRYTGTTLRYQPSLSVQPTFRERLARFELVVAAVAREVYGRPPRRVLDYGAYACRSERDRGSRLSEHALGNAVDIAGFDFGPATRDEPLPPHVPAALSKAFQVRVAQHWQPRRARTASAQQRAAAQVHSRFLQRLFDRLIDEPHLFRGLIGPADPRHADHFHFDAGPWPYVRR